MAAKLFTPKAMYKGKRYPSLIHPMGVLKEQTSQLYATKLATRSFVALSFKINPCIKAITTVSICSMGCHKRGAKFYQQGRARSVFKRGGY
ncbi:conserved hypothetical signal peptide protein [Helicobacter heilmannii]|nr:conserved hypothetical signal peptide protein [Helicobacter heilmannii]